MRRSVSLVAAAAVLAVGAAIAFFFPSGRAQTRWVITDLGILGQPVALNDRGQVVAVGRVDTASRTSGGSVILWRNGVVRDLGNPGAMLDYTDTGSAPPRMLTSDIATYVVAINESGQIVGTGVLGGEDAEGHGGIVAQRGFVWRSGRLSDLGSFGGRITTVAGINQSGQIVGTSETGAGRSRAFLWENGRMLEFAHSCFDSYASAINDRGRVVGWCTTATGRSKAVLWENGKMRHLGALNGGDSGATDINESGQVVGTNSDDAVWIGPFLWENGRMRYVAASDGALPKINDRGQIVGLGSTEVEPDHGLLWENGKLRDLGTLGGRDTYLKAINDHGQGVGIAVDASMVQRAFVWQNGEMHQLAALPGGVSSSAIAINNHNEHHWNEHRRGPPDASRTWTLCSG